MSTLIEPMNADKESVNLSYNLRTVPGVASVAEKGARRMAKGQSFPCVRGGGYVVPDKCLTNFIKKKDLCARDNGCTTGMLLFKKQLMGFGFCSDVHCREIDHREKNLYGRNKVCLKCFIGELEHDASEPETITEETKPMEIEKANPAFDRASGNEDGFARLVGADEHVVIGGRRFCRVSHPIGSSEITLTKTGNVVLSAGFVRENNIEELGLKFVEVMVSDDKETLCLFFSSVITQYSRTVSFNKAKKTLPKISCRPTLEKVKACLGYRYKVQHVEAKNVFMFDLSDPLPLKR